ncbi:MAG: hypothetical protein FWG77_10760 [Treponema sp.]|nr:hypothetical protein [Treponema sp.]
MRKKPNGRVSRDFKGLKEWEAMATKQEKALKNKAIEYDKLYFDDFNFELGSITGDVYDFVRIKDCPQQVLDGNKLYELTPIVIKDCRFHIKEMEDAAGNCNGWDITIHPEALKNRDTILHEMVHLRINVMPNNFREILTFCLYKKIKKELKKFDSFLIDHATAIASLYNPDLWHHGTLFFLKSLDLDIRLNLDIGTVYGYSL